MKLSEIIFRPLFFQCNKGIERKPFSLGGLNRQESRLLSAKDTQESIKLLRLTMGRTMSN